MIFNHIDKKDSRNLVRNLFKLTFSKKDLPFKSIIMPQGFPTIAYIFGGKQEVIYKNSKNYIKGLVSTGQFYGTYDFKVNDISFNMGIVLHPTALYKILNTDVSKITNTITSIQKLNNDIVDKFEPIFLNYQNDIPNFQKKAIELIESLEITINKDVVEIDKAIDYILENDGLVHVTDILKIIHISQKSLETKFKKIVGLTPNRYIRQYRFMNLIVKYQSNEFELTDLIYMFNYFDYSHLNKDFKFFMNQTPKSFFKQDYPLLKEYLK